MYVCNGQCVSCVHWRSGKRIGLEPLVKACFLCRASFVWIHSEQRVQESKSILIQIIVLVVVVVAIDTEKVFEFVFESAWKVLTLHGEQQSVFIA